MSGWTGTYQEWAQLILSVLALIIAPPSLAALYKGVFHRIKIRCTPIYRRQGGGPALWEIEITNRSRTVGGFEICVFPFTPGNTVKSFRQISGRAAGLSVSASIDDGTLVLSFRRFSKIRRFSLLVWFEHAEAPYFESDKHTINRKVEFEAKEGRTPSIVYLEIAYHRMMLMMLVFAGVTALVVGRIIYFAAAR